MKLTPKTIGIIIAVIVVLIIIWWWWRKRNNPCPSTGNVLVADPSDKTKYYECVDGKSTSMKCATGEFDANLQACKDV